MKINYRLASGKIVEVEVTEAQAEVIVDVNRKFNSNERKFKTRRAKETSLDYLNDEYGWEPMSDSLTPDVAYEEQELHGETELQKTHVREIVTLLTPKQQEIVQLHYFEGKSLRQIAAIFGTDHKNISGQLAVIHKRMKKLF